MNTKDVRGLKKGDWVEVDRDYGIVKSISERNYGPVIFLKTVIGKTARYFKPNEIKRRVGGKEFNIIKLLFGKWGMGRQQSDDND